jgi:fermentation-respiration switch protein FrsA (DUF1100 family)
MTWLDMSTVSTVAWFMGIGLTSVVVAAYYFQDGLLYVPSLPGLPRDVMVTPFAFGWKSELAEYEQVWVREPTDNLKLQAWFFRCHKDANIARSRPTVLFLHSNAGNLSHRIPNIRDLVEICRFNVFILSYRGYGRSEGTPSEEGLKRDAAAALRYLATVDRPDVDPTKIIVLGRSLGGAVGIWLAANFPEWTKGLMVENAFTSVPDMVDVVLPALKYVKWLSRNTWNNVREIERVTVPIIFFSSARDELVPPAHMHALHNAARHAPLARFVSFPHALHMNCVPEADHQMLTTAGFLTLADVEARVVRDAAGRVVDWRGLQVASYDRVAEQIVYRTPRALVVNSGVQALVELSDRDERVRWSATARIASKPARDSTTTTGARLSVVTTRGHELFVRAPTSATFVKQPAAVVAASTDASVHFLAAARNGVAVNEQSELELMAALHLSDRRARWHALLELYGYWLVDGAALSGKRVSFGQADEAFVNARVGRLSAEASARLFGRSVRVGEWAWQLPRVSLERIVAGMRAAARGASTVTVTDAGLRDDLVRLLLHAGMSATCEASGSVWRVEFGNTTALIEPALPLVGDNVREFKFSGRTWCFDMSSDGASSDGFIVVRRASATGEASRPTIQGNCFQQPGYYQHVIEFARDDLGFAEASPHDFPAIAQ